MDEKPNYLQNAQFHYNVDQVLKLEIKEVKTFFFFVLYYYYNKAANA